MNVIIMLRMLDAAVMKIRLPRTQKAAIHYYKSSKVYSFMLISVHILYETVYSIVQHGFTNTVYSIVQHGFMYTFKYDTRPNERRPKSREQMKTEDAESAQEQKEMQKIEKESLHRKIQLFLSCMNDIEVYVRRHWNVGVLETTPDIITRKLEKRIMAAEYGEASVEMGQDSKKKTCRRTLNFDPQRNECDDNAKDVGCRSHENQVTKDSKSSNSLLQELKGPNERRPKSREQMKTEDAESAQEQKEMQKIEKESLHRKIQLFLSCMNDIEVLRIPVCDESLKPFVGKKFSSLKEGIHFYTTYARSVGFDVRRSSARTVDGVCTWRYVVCSREGEKHVADPSPAESNGVSKKRRRRVSMRCGCEARIVFKYVSDFGYVVHKFDEEHNHELVEEQDKVFLKVNRKLDYMHQKFIIDCARASIGPTHANKLLNEFLGGQDYVGCTIVEVRNFTRDMKAYIEGSDAQMLLNEMKRKKEICESFTYDFEVDEEDKLKRLFWCDPISKRNFHMFGDVVAFDTTYSTNKYCMIFAPFTGKDNHGRPVTFAAGLLSNENSDSFSWLFERFVSCMGATPRLIITDQDLGMKTAINQVLVGTLHRWCMWYIMLKVADKVSKELHADEDFKEELNSCVWSEMIEPNEFIRSWNDIMVRYDLKDNSWFKSMFKAREYWVPAFFRDFSMSELVRTTSISECENSFYKRYTKSRSNLLEFWMNFNHALEAQRHYSSKLNYLDKSVVPLLATEVPLEKHATTIYNQKMFEQVQQEISWACFKCRILEISNVDNAEHYSIIDHLGQIMDVSYDKEDDAYVCGCKLFVRKGILCSHIFFVFKNKGLKSIPDRYVVGRWLKASMVKPVHDIICNDIQMYTALDENQILHNQIMSEFYNWMHKIDGNSERMNAFRSGINDLGRCITEDETEESVANKNSIIERYYGQSIPEKIDVRPPDVVKTKGSGSRLKLRKEKAIQMMNKPLRRCAKCKNMGRHDARNCDKINKGSKEVV